MNQDGQSYTKDISGDLVHASNVNPNGHADHYQNHSSLPSMLSRRKQDTAASVPLSRTSTNSNQSGTEHHGVDNSLESALSLPGATPLPKLQMLVICIILISDPLTSTILFPFIYFMLKDFNLSEDETEIGMYAGWITSIFFVAQFCTAIPWGRYSDRHGRRPVLLIGLMGNAISICSFGLSKTLSWAIVSRTLCGVLNGNGGVARSMVSEITDETNRALAFSLFSFCWGLGMIGPALGGYFCNPVDNFPGLFGGNTFLKEYPYFLPCFLSALCSFIGFVIGFFYLKESNPVVLNKLHKDQEQRPLASGTTVTYNSTNNIDIVDELDAKYTGEIPLGFSGITRTAVVTITAFAQVFRMLTQRGGLKSGLGSNSAELARALSIAGTEQLICQFIVYPRLNRTFNTLTLVRLSLFLFLPVYVLFPELSRLQNWLAVNLPDNPAGQIWLFRCGYMSLLVIRYFSNCLAFTGMMIMVNNSAESSVLGTVNGVSQSSLSFVRAFAPTVGGTLWSISLRAGNPFPFDNHLVYYLVALLTCIGYLQSFQIPENVALGGKKGNGRE